MSKLKQNETLCVAIAIVLASIGTANATEWVTEIQGGQIRFDDWGYTGPNGQTAEDFAPTNGFGGPDEGNSLDPTGGIGQIQHVVTKEPDHLTPDPIYSFLSEFTNADLYPNANTDAKVNFYNWGYTTGAGSTFNNMQIDFDGDYLVNRNDMQFQMYTAFDYKNEGPASIPTDNGEYIAPDDGRYATTINFQPYALSDATGWCGSVTASNPAALEGMAGQVHFDFAFEVFFAWSPKDENGNFTPGTGSMQIVSDFEMRSYGTITLDIAIADGGTTTTHYEANAVVNNTNPTVENINPDTGLKEVGGGNSVDENWYNQVSFMGAGILAPGVWVLVDSQAGITTKPTGDLVIRHDQVLRVAEGISTIMPTEAIPEGTEWMYHANFFANYPFLMRADGNRIVDAIDFSVYSDFSSVPASAYDQNNNLVNLEGVVIQDLSLTDNDGDGIPDDADNCPLDANTDQTDTDNDGLGDACDTDDDGDSINDGVDNCPLDANTDQTDTDNDGLGDACDADDDNDSINDGVDNCPLDANTDQTDTDNDGLGDVCDADDDNDSINDGVDNCPLDANTDQTDTDNDGLGDACDADDDNDSINDGVDNCPLDANTDQTDNDNDGLGDVCDADDDNDSIIDGVDNCPLDANTDQTDTDNDGLGDVCDADDDGDSINDVVDNCPVTSNPDQNDSGGVDSNSPDGIGDVCQCGDISGDGKITNTDSVLIKRHLLGLPSKFDADFCDVNGDALCTNTDAVLIQRSILGLPPGLSQSCVAAGN